MEKILMNFFMNLFQMSLSASYLILAVLLVRFVLRKAPKRMRSFLWLLVGIRLIFPFSVESIFSLIPDTKVADAYLYEMEQPAYNTMANTEMKKPVSQPIVSFTEMSSTKPQTTFMIYTKIWIVGMAFMLGYMFYSYLWLKNRVKMSVPTDIVFDHNGTNDTNHAVKFYLSDAIDSPFLFGILHPRIYVPCCIARDELPYVLCHELTHKKRKDYLIKPLGFLILSVYWFNPCVWIAYIMLCKDIELICDEYVVREHGTEYKKAYSQALLNSAVNHHKIAACPIAFGEVSVKERVKNVLNYKKPAFWLMAVAVLACMIVPVCFMTQKKTDVTVQPDPHTAAQPDIQKKDTPVQMNIQIDSIDLIAGEYEMFLPVPEQEEYLSLNTYNDTKEDAYIFMPRLSLGRDGKFSFGYDPASSYLIFGSYDFVSDSVNAVTDDGKYHYQFTRIGHGLLRFDADESSKLHKVSIDAAAPVENGSIFVKNSVSSQEQADVLKLPAAAKTIEQWAKAFCDRDAKMILKLAGEDVKKQFAEQELLVQGADSEGDTASFGWSSPWPWGDMYDENGTSCNYHIVSATEHDAEILYYAWVSDPHVTVWRERLTYDMEDGDCVITSESLQYMDGICIAEEFHHAYPNGIAETMMDYYSFNGAGEALNENAKENRNSDVYKNLFAPDTAAISLLNILNNPNKVGTHVRKSGTDENICIVTFEFYEDGSAVTVYMMRPYGADGIWVPYFLLDSCDARAVALQETETAKNKAERNLVYDHKMEINMLPLTPKE